ncbi:MAG: M12 family metallo-peptidase [Lentimicrobiaceae bacterium]|nr:M12 family metallo-peptidase [Lentimicrobiaceae bacterium]
MEKLVILVLKKVLIVLFLVSFWVPANSQNLIELNASGAKNLQAQESSNLIVKEIFKDADRYRLFDYNKQLVNLNPSHIGDTLLLGFFEDKQYKSVITHVERNYFGRTSIISKIVNTKFGYCFMVVSENTISIAAELPQEDESFFAVVKEGTAYLSQVKKSKLDATALNCADALIPEQRQQQYEKSGQSNKGIDDPVVIDLLMVYTPAAAQWALESSLVTDIDDLIAQAFQKSNLAMDNSGTGITFRIAYVHLTDYVEDNTIEDLYRITDPWDGYMDEVHDLRDQYYADEIVFIPKVDFTGGVAWLLDDENGFWEDYLAVALSRVQQTSWTYTAVHEVGHNMGCGHHAEQMYQAGPGLFYYSSGWRGTISGDKVCSIMTYESGSYFPDGQNHVRIPYFSSPDIFIDGVVIGDPITADNVLTLKRTKTAVSNYRTAPGPMLAVYPSSLNFNNVIINTSSLSQSISISGALLTEEITYTKGGADAEAFNIIETTWDPLVGGTFSVTFLPTEQKVYNATITFKSQGAWDKVIPLKGKGIATYAINATAGENGTISPVGEIILNEGESRNFTFAPHAGYQIENVLVDGASNQQAIADGYYLFNNVMDNHSIHVTFVSLSIGVNELEYVKIFSHQNNIYIQNVKALHASSPTVEIWDMSGRLVYQGILTRANSVIPLQTHGGIYSVKVISQEKNALVEKVLIIR